MLELNKVYCIDALAGLKQLGDESIDLILTSPPYWGKRDYGENAKKIWGGEKDCEHIWGADVNWKPGGGPPCSTSQVGATLSGIQRVWNQKSNFCNKCGAWQGQLGLEPNFNLYIAHLFEVFTECRRMLKRSGSFWLNIGDTYSGSSCGKGDSTLFQNYRRLKVAKMIYNKPSPQAKCELPDKCVIGIPWRLTLKLIDEGSWVLRNDVIWEKGNPMPGSWKDRFTNVYEDVFFFVRDDAQSDWYILSNRPNPEKYIERYRAWREVQEWWGSSQAIKHKSEIPKEFLPRCSNLDYYFNLDVVREPHKVQSLERYQRAVNLGAKQVRGKYFKKDRSFIGSPQHAPKWFREEFEKDSDYKGKFEDYLESQVKKQHGKNPGDVWGYEEECAALPDIWQINTQGLDAEHYAAFPEALCERIILAACPPSGVVLDPFCGSGRALVVAKRLGRSFIGFDIVPEFVELAEKLIAKEPMKLDRFGVDFDV